MTHLGTFLPNSAHPDKRLLLSEGQLLVEDYGPVTVDRVRDLDAVGQIQWLNQDLRRMAYAINQPPVQQQTTTSPPPSQKSGSSPMSIVWTIIGVLVILGICAAAYQMLNTTSGSDEQPSEPTTQPDKPSEPEAPTPPTESEETT